MQPMAAFSALHSWNVHEMYSSEKQAAYVTWKFSCFNDFLSSSIPGFPEMEAPTCSDVVSETKAHSSHGDKFSSCATALEQQLQQPR